MTERIYAGPVKPSFSVGCQCSGRRVTVLLYYIVLKCLAVCPLLDSRRMPFTRQVSWLESHLDIVPFVRLDWRRTDCFDMTWHATSNEISRLKLIYCVSIPNLKLQLTSFPLGKLQEVIVIDLVQRCRTVCTMVWGLGRCCSYDELAYFQPLGV